MKRSIFIALFSLLSLIAYSSDGDWRIYSAYHNATKVVGMNGLVYVLSDGGLYSYDPEDTSITTYDKSDILNDFGITNILGCDQTKELVVVYRNGNIDLLGVNGDVYNLPDLKMKSLSDKTINDVIIDGDILYICTNSGIVCVDIKSRSFGDFYNFGEQTLTLAIVGNNFLVSTRGGAYKGDKTKNLLDHSNWEKVSSTTASFKKYLLFNGTIFAMTPNNLFAITFDGTKYSHKSIASDRYNDLCICDGKLLALTSTGHYLLFESSDNYKTFDDDFGMNYIIHHASEYWAACGVNGLMGVDISGGAVSQRVGSLIPESPMRNYCYTLNLIDNSRLVVGGGRFNYSSNSDRAGTIMEYSDNKWKLFDEDGPNGLYDNMEGGGPLYYRNVTDVVQDPHESNRFYAGTARSGVYVFDDYILKSHYTYDNSPLTSILPDDKYAAAFVRTTGLQFDSQDNLWMLNTECDTIIRILRRDNSWTSYYVPEIKGYPTFDHTVFDSRGWAWINSRRSDNKALAGVLIVNTNNNPGNPSGFTHKFFGTFYNQDGTSYEPTLMNAICFDLNGAVWLGYDKGLYMSSNPASLLEGGESTVLTQVKVPRNDGTNLADYLLNDVPVKCITIDGGNRKWIGTSGLGAYLISSDGLETIQHFTSDNSPLINDYIYDIKINGITGEVFFATDAGLCSFIGDATDPVEKFDKDLVKVYPNPVRPEYHGNIAIRGLMNNSDVKIVSASGKLVNQGISVGGEYKWDGRLSVGKECASGIYYILATDEEGNNGVVGKFLVVRE